MRREFGWPLVELGSIRLRLGDLDGAEEAFLQAHRRAWPPLPGIALLRMEQGDLAAAATLIADAVRNPPELPWKERPPFGDLRLVPLLEAQSEIAAACGDADTAASAAERLRQTAVRYASSGFAASAALATAREHLLKQDFPAAIDSANAAATAWCELGAPFDAAVARTVVGRAHEGAGNTVHDWRTMSSRRSVRFGAPPRWQSCLPKRPHSRPKPRSQPACSVAASIGTWRSAGLRSCCPTSRACSTSRSYSPGPVMSSKH